jgi:hypothetical protein
VKRLLLVLFLLSSVAYCSARYIEKPSDVWVEDVHYDSDLNEIIVHAHADFLFFNIDKIYGIKLKDNTNAAETVDRMLGATPKISELRMLK